MAITIIIGFAIMTTVLVTVVTCNITSAFMLVVASVPGDSCDSGRRELGGYLSFLNLNQK